MTESRTRLLVRAATFAAAFMMGLPSPSLAQDPPQVIELEPGIACDFGLRITSTGGNQVTRVFKDKNGNVVRTLSAGRGAQLTFTNLATGTTLSLKAFGSVSHVTNNPDNTSTWVTEGQNVLVLFPTDVPAGPSTTLYLGRVEFTVDNISGIFTLQRTSGKSTDICAALSA
jgi:hypothetical protein